MQVAEVPVGSLEVAGRRDECGAVAFLSQKPGFETGHVIVAHLKSFAPVALERPKILVDATEYGFNIAGLKLDDVRIQLRGLGIGCRCEGAEAAGTLVQIDIGNDIVAENR